MLLSFVKLSVLLFFVAFGAKWYISGVMGRQFGQIVFLLPEKQNPRYQWGVFLYQQREWETALTQLTMSIALKPDHLWSYYYRALVLVELNHQQKALNDLEKALEINPEQSSVINLYNRIKKSLDSE